MISQADLQQRLLAASGFIPPPRPIPQAPPKPSQYQGLLKLAGDPNVPEAIRTSATDAANKHAALARKAQTDPNTYQSGGEVAEDQGYAEKAKKKPGLGSVLSQGLDAMEGAMGLPPGNPQGPPPPPLVLDQGIEAAGMIPPPAAPMPAALNSPEQGMGPTAGQPLPAPPLMAGDDPALAQPRGGLLPFQPGVPLPGMPPHPALTGFVPPYRETPQERARGFRERLFDNMRKTDPRATLFVDKQLMRGKEKTTGFGLMKERENPFGAWAAAGEAEPESPNDARLASQSFPLTPPGEPVVAARGAPGVPVSKPGNIPAKPGRGSVRPAVAAKEPGQWKMEDGAPGPLGTVTRTSPSAGLEAAGPPTPLVPQGNKAAGSGGSTAVDPNAAPTFNKGVDAATKPAEAPKPIDPLAWALIKGGAAMMASNKQFGQALGEALGAGVEGYAEARNVDFENLRKANEDARASQKEARETYTDTQLRKFIAEGELRQGERGLDIRSLQGDREYNLGQGGLALNQAKEAHDYELGLGGLALGQTKAAQDYELGQGGLGMRGQEIEIARQRALTDEGMLDVAQSNADVQRQQLKPSEARELDAYAQRAMEADPRMTPAQARAAAIALYKELHPASSYGGGLDAILAGQQPQVNINDPTLMGARPQ